MNKFKLNIKPFETLKPDIDIQKKTCCYNCCYPLSISMSILFVCILSCFISN